MKSVCVALGLVFLTPAVSLATLFLWHDRVRPRVSLQEALAIAEKVLGEDAKNRYCVEVSIYGNPMGEPTPGAWNLLFAAADGSKKHVYVNMEGSSKVTSWNKAIDWKKDAGRRRDLKDAYVRLQELFKKEELDVQLELKDGHLTGAFRTRKYEVYEREIGLHYSDKLSEQIGPAGDGFMFAAELADESKLQGSFESAPYWDEATYGFPTAVKGKVIVLQEKLGRQVNNKITQQIHQAFGIDLQGT